MLCPLLGRKYETLSRYSYRVLDRNDNASGVDNKGLGIVELNRR